MKEVNVVGLYNTPDRGPEYGKDPGKTRAYMDFVVTSVKPFVDAHYRTLPDRENTAVMGSSMGGLISFLLAWQYPQVFSAAACLSPAFTVGDWLDDVEKYDGPPKPIRIYMDNGGVGMDRERMQPGCERMLDILPKKGFILGENLEWFLDEKAEHNEAAWAARLHRPLLFLFGK
jgi:predicted alpha/beta superfamily hydrolase